MSNASLDFVIDAFCDWFDKRIEYAKSISSSLFGEDHPSDDYDLVCTFYYNGDAIVDGKVQNSWCDYKYTSGSNETGNGSYDPESILIDMFEHGVKILFKEAVYFIDFTSFSTEPSEEEVFQFSTVHSYGPLTEVQLLKLVRRAKQLEFTPEDEREYEWI